MPSPFQLIGAGADEPAPVPVGGRAGLPVQNAEGGVAQRVEEGRVIGVHDNDDGVVVGAVGLSKSTRPPWRRCGGLQEQGQRVKHVVGGQRISVAEGHALVQLDGQLQIAGPLIAFGQVVGHGAVGIDRPQVFQHAGDQGPGGVVLQIRGGIEGSGVGVGAEDKGLGAALFRGAEVLVPGAPVSAGAVVSPEPPLPQAARLAAMLRLRSNDKSLGSFSSWFPP